MTDDFFGSVMRHQPQMGLLRRRRTQNGCAMTYSRPFSEPADRAKRCRDRAEQCRAWADLATHQVSKWEFMDVSRQWDELAKEIEQIERAQKVVRNVRRATARLTGGRSPSASATHLAGGGKDHL